MGLCGFWRLFISHPLHSQFLSKSCFFCACGFLLGFCGFCSLPFRILCLTRSSPAGGFLALLGFWPWLPASSASPPPAHPLLFRFFALISTTTPFLPTSSPAVNALNGWCIAKRTLKVHWRIAQKALEGLGVERVLVGQYGCKLPLSFCEESWAQSAMSPAPSTSAVRGRTCTCSVRREGLSSFSAPNSITGAAPPNPRYFLGFLPLIQSSLPPLLFGFLASNSIITPASSWGGCQRSWPTVAPGRRRSIHDNSMALLWERERCIDISILETNPNV